MKKFVAIVFALALAGLFAGSSLAADKVLGTFKAMTPEGKEFNNASIKDKDLMFVFAQMACRQCQLELQDMNKIAADLKGKAYVVLVDMNADNAKEIYGKMNYKMDLLLDPEFSMPSAAGLSSTPSTIIVNKKGVITFETSGYARGQLEEILPNIGK